MKPRLLDLFSGVGGFFTETARSLDTTGGYATAQGGTLVLVIEEEDE